MLMDGKKAGIAHRQLWIEELARLDEEIALAVVRRRELAEKINIAGRAITGTGIYETTPPRRAWTPSPKPPFVDPIVVVPQPAEEGPDGQAATELHGRALRDACNAILLAMGTALTATDLARLLGAHGHAVKAPHSRTIPNALRVDIREGRVRRVGRGLYQAVAREG